MLVTVLLCAPLWATEQYTASGMVMKVDMAHKTMLLSCDSIPRFIDAMTMPFDVRDARELKVLTPGMVVDFTLIVDRNSSYAEHVQVRPYESAEQDPLTARRLKLLNHLSKPATSASKTISAGQTVPDFTLTDQAHRSVSLSQYAGKVVALNFIYTSCALPNFCLSNL